MNTIKNIKQEIGSATKVFILSSLFFMFMVPSLASAQTSASSDQATRTQCFATLKENMAEAEIFSEPLTTLATTTYADIEPKFSAYYKNLSSFGVETDKGDLEMRMYSFGRLTGYVHPPKMPFPSSYKSDMWSEPTKEFIVAEEYAVDPTAQKHFIDCVFFSLGGDDLSKITRENYAYDGAMVSLIKTPPDNSYKAWYSENTSFDYKNNPFVDWRRLFIYSRSTQNSYFDKYDVADAFPANKVQSFGILKFFLNNLITVQDYDQTGVATVKYMTPNGSGKLVQINAPKEVLPINPEGVNNIFPLTTYYQAIEDHFPNFAKDLSLRGTLKYDTFKQLILEQNLNPETGKLVSAIIDPRQIVAYGLDKESKEKQGMNVSDPEKDGLLLAARDADTAVKLLTQKGVTLENLKDQKLITNTTEPGKTAGAIAVVVVIIIASVAVVVWKRRNSAN